MRVVAGVLFDEAFDVAPNNALDDGVPAHDVPFRDEFPYVALAHSGTDPVGLGGLERTAGAAGAEDGAEDDADATEEGETTDEEATPEEADADDAVDGAALTLTMEEIDGSGVSGTAALSTDEDGNTTVVLALDGATGSHPAHIHEGTCNELNPNPEYPLADVDEGGSSESVIEVGLDHLLVEPHAINVHLSAEQIGVYVTCGNIE